MKEEQTIFHVHREERDKWTSVINSTISDSRMSFRATGLLIYLLSKPGDWRIYQSQLSSAKTEGRDATITAMNELRALGYITKELIREKGKIVRTEWHVFEVPRRLTEKPETAEPETVLPVTVKPQLLITDKNKELKNKEESPIPPAEPVNTASTIVNNGQQDCAPASPPLGVDSSDLPKKTSARNTQMGKLPTSEPAIRIANLFGRRLTTEWSDAEIKTFRKLGVIELSDLDLLEAYYAAERAKARGIHRRDLKTFLNNFRSEVDRAEQYALKHRAKVEDDDGSAF